MASRWPCSPRPPSPTRSRRRWSRRRCRRSSTSSHTHDTAVTWVLTVYLLTASIATPIFGRLGDMFGKERDAARSCSSCSALGSLVARAVALDRAAGRRAARSRASAARSSRSRSGSSATSSRREQVAPAIGLISATFGIGGGVGLVLARRDRRPPLLRVDLLDRARSSSRSRSSRPTCSCRSRRSRARRKIDWVGAALLSVGARSALLLARQRGQHAGAGPRRRMLGLFAAAAVVLLAWVRFELRVPEPLVDMRDDAPARVWTTNLTGAAGRLRDVRLVHHDPAVRAGAARAPATASAPRVTEAGLFLLPSTTVMLFAGPARGLARQPLRLAAAAADRDARWPRSPSPCSRSSTTHRWAALRRDRADGRSASASPSPRWPT